MDPARSLGDYDRQGITVRVTRANYRTGRLEISAHVTLDGFVNFMEKQAWRIDAQGLDKMPLGSLRLQVPGNPNAVNSGLASGRFPGVFAPYPIDALYPAGDPENDLLHKLLDKWLSGPEVAEKVKQILLERPVPQGKGEHYWDDLFDSWLKSGSMRDFFPRSGDVYVDGGSIDNTPSNSAVDYVREWADNGHRSRRSVSLELFVIFLETEPKLNPVDVQDPAVFQVVQRTLAIQGAAKSSSDTNTVSTINTFGQRGEDLAETLETVLGSYRGLVNGLDEEKKAAVEENVYALAKELPLGSYLGESPTGILERLSAWAEEKKSTGLPVQVEVVKIFPDEMPMGTLQFTERLGYRKANAIKMLAAGCYDALWSLRTHLEADNNPDSRDRQVLGMARKWMGFESLPADKIELEKLHQEWRCMRTACAFYDGYCGHGK